ncbi:MAG: (deoxy)nucleoside triphosphate pyrophosphohydrolase [Bacteroidota bacterium]
MIDVTAGIIIREGKILIAQRKRGKNRELLWELPGGKANENETLEECLKRELNEEFGVDAGIGERFMSHHHKYPDMELTLHAFYVTELKGKLQLNEHKRIAWIKSEDYTKYDITEADLPIMEELTRKN